MFLTADVTVEPNFNEIRDFKYVDKAELQSMFNDSGTCIQFMRRRGMLDLSVTANSFTPWFKLIARDFLFGWWDELLSRTDANGKVVAKSLDGLVDGSKVVKM